MLRGNVLDGLAAHVAVSEVQPSGVVVDGPSVETGLEGFDALVERLTYFHTEKFVEYGAVES